MSPYRTPGAPSKPPPRAPWWRLFWASVAPRGTIVRLWERNYKRRYGIVRDPERWARLRIATDIMKGGA